MANALGEFEQLLLLALLHLEGDTAHGVSIRATIEQRTGRRVSAGAVYTALDRLEQRGLVSSRLGEPGAPGQRGGRPRRYYRLERAGARALERSLDTLTAMARGARPRLGVLTAGMGRDGNET